MSAKTRTSKPASISAARARSRLLGEALGEQVDIDEVPGSSPVEEREHLASGKFLGVEGGASDCDGARQVRRCVHG